MVINAASAKQPLTNANTLRSRAEESASLFPALLLSAQRISQSVATGLHGRRRAGPGETFWQHRPYMSGDDVTAIDWRQSARAAGRLYVRQNEWEAAASAWLWCDSSPSMNYRSSKNHPYKADRAKVLATALTILLSQAGERVGVLGAHDRSFQGRATPERILQLLLGAPSEENAPSPRMTPPPGSHIVLLGDFYTDPAALEHAMTSFANHAGGVAIVQICDPAEEDFPYAGRVEFADLESRERLTFGNTNALQDDYQYAFNAHREHLKSMAQKCGWRFITHRTDKQASTVLLSLFNALSDKQQGG